MNDSENPVFHETCFACGTENVHGLQMEFQDGPNGCTCDVTIPMHFQSYDGVVHGGIVATMLDAAMVHSLRGHDGHAPVTCRLEVRYLRPVSPGEILTVSARRKTTRGKIVWAEADIHCVGVSCARARGAFTLTDR